jgi:type IV secretion system protein TrbL
MKPRGAGLAVLALVACVAVASPLAAQAPPQLSPDSIVDGLLEEFQTASQGWFLHIQLPTERTFALLATLELALSGLFWAIHMGSLDAVVEGLLRRFILLAFFFALLTSFPLWLPAVGRGFEAAGQTATGASTLNPALLLDNGVTIAANILGSFADGTLLPGTTSWAVGLLVAVLIVVSYAFIAAQLCLALIEMYLVLSGGVLFLAFTACRITAPFAEGYLVYSFRIGTKIYLLYLLTSAGLSLSRQWAAISWPGASLVAPSFAPYFAVLAGAFVLALLVWRTDAIAGNLVQGASFHLRDALR